MKKLSVLTGFLLLSLTAGAQPAAPLTLDEAVGISLENNPQIGAVNSEIEAAVQERKATIGLRLPQIGVTGLYLHMSDNVEYDINRLKVPVNNALSGLGGLGIQIPADIAQQIQSLLGRDWSIKLVDRNLASVDGSVALPIFTGGKINAATNAAKINEQTAYTRGEQTRNQLVSEVVERYYGLILAQDVVRVREQVLESVREHLRDAVLLEQNGMIAHTERLFFEVKVAEAERDLYDARTQVRTVEDALRNTLNTADPVAPVSPMFILDNLDPVEVFKDMALANSPLLRQVGLGRDLAMQNVTLKRSEYFPQVAAFGAGNFYRYNRNILPNWAVGAGVSWNIFDGTARERKLAAAKQTVRQVESLEEKAQNDILLLIGKLYDEMENLRYRMPSLEKSIHFAEEYLRTTNIGFREGVKTSTEVMDAETNLAAVRIERLTTAYSYDLMLAALLEASGASGDFTHYANSGRAVPIVYNDTTTDTNENDIR